MEPSSRSRSAPRRASARGRRGGRARGAAVGRGGGRTAAGDAFTACLVVSLLEGRERAEASAGLRGRGAGGVDAVRGLRSPRPQRLTRYWPRERRSTSLAPIGKPFFPHEPFDAVREPPAPSHTVHPLMGRLPEPPDADPARLRPGPRRRDRAPARARQPGAAPAGRHDSRGKPDARQDDRQRAARPRVRRPRTSRSRRAPIARSTAISSSPPTSTASRASTVRRSRRRGAQRSSSTQSTSSPSASSAPTAPSPWCPWARSRTLPCYSPATRRRPETSSASC